MHEPPRQLREWRALAGHASPMAVALGRSASIAIAAAVFLAVAGAFGTGAAPLVLRLSYWTTTMVAASVLATGLFMPIYRRGLLDRRPVLSSAAAGLILALPLTVLVWFVSGLFFPDRAPRRLAALAAYFPPVLLVSILMTAVNHLAADRASARRLTHAAPDGAEPPRFIERLPLRLRGAELYAIEAEDHYLRLHTSQGSDLILMRLSDAVAELEGIEGARTHRSWWVARMAVTGARRGDGRAVLTLRNGVEAPVSRSYAGPLREAGWF
jgi:DNA-binding LytR/AlgR family response regulator